MEKMFRLGDLIRIQGSLEALLDQALPIRVTYGARKMLKRFKDEIESFQNAHNALLVKFGEPNPTKTRYTVAPDRLDEFRAEVENLTDVEVTIPITQFSLEDLETTRLKAGDVINLEFLIEGSDEN